MRALIKTLVILTLLLVLIVAGFRGAAFLRENVYRFSDPARGGSFVTTDMGEVYVPSLGRQMARLFCSFMGLLDGRRCGMRPVKP